MKSFERAKELIAKDVDEVFSSVERDICEVFFGSQNHDLAYMRQAIGQHAGTLIEGKQLLLLDTALNYVSDDALKALEGVEPRILNEFYEHDRALRAQLKSKSQVELPPDPVMLSPDLRVAYAAGVGVIGGGLIGMICRQVLGVWGQVISTALSGALAYKVVYEGSQAMVKKRIEDEIREYIKRSKHVTLQGLLAIMRSYKEDFWSFLKRHGLA